MKFKAIRLLLCIPLVTTAVAVPLNMESEINPGHTLIDFETLSTGAQTDPLIFGPVTFTSPPDGLGVVDVSSFAANGTEVSGNTLTPRSGGFGGGTYQPIDIIFATGVSEVGLGWFDVNTAGSAIDVFNIGGILLETITADLGAAGGVHADFVGVRRATNEIGRVQVRVGAGNDVYSIDNVRYYAIPPQAIPLPGAALLMAAGLLLLRRRER